MTNTKVKTNCCNQKPVISLPSGEKLCKKHFSKYFEEKVFKTISRFKLLDKEENLGVALSGGKDSLTVLKLLNEFKKINPKIKVSAIAIDEGIAGYRDKTIVRSKEFCKENDIPLNIYSYEKEFGMSLDNILKVLKVKPCSICGVFRRYLLNKKSKELGFTKLVTGHNLDDECQSIMMNQFRNQVEASARLGPKTGIIESKQFIQRIKPLYLCTEKEVTTYAFMNNLLDEHSECPNVPQSFRAKVRDILNDFEANNPGTKYSIVNSFLQVLPSLKEKLKEKAEIEPLKECKECGEPASNEICKACDYVKKLEEAKLKVKVK